MADSRAAADPTSREAVFMAKFQNNKDWWADFHEKLLFALVIRCQGESAESKDFVEGLLNEWTPLSALRFFGKDDPLAEALKFCITPNEAALENADPRVATPSPVIWILFSDSSCALITGRRHTLRKYDLAEHFKERKPWYVTEWVHEMMWGKTLRHLVKRGIELAREAKEKHGADARVNLHLSWFGNELVGEAGIAQNPNWPYDGPNGVWPEIMADCQRHLTWFVDKANGFANSRSYDRALVCGLRNPPHLR